MWASSPRTRDTGSFDVATASPRSAQPGTSIPSLPVGSAFRAAAAAVQHRPLGVQRDGSAKSAADKDANTSGANAVKSFAPDLDWAGPVGISDVKLAEVLRYHWSVHSREMGALRVQVSEVQRTVEGLHKAHSTLERIEADTARTLGQTRDVVSRAEQRWKESAGKLAEELRHMHAVHSADAGSHLKRMEEKLDAQVDKVSGSHHIQHQEHCRDLREAVVASDTSCSALRRQVAEVSREDHVRHLQQRDLVDLALVDLRVRMQEEMDQLWKQHRRFQHSECDDIRDSVKQAISTLQQEVAQLAEANKSLKEELCSFCDQAHQELRSQVEEAIRKESNERDLQHSAHRGHVSQVVDSLQASFDKLSSTVEEENQKLSHERRKDFLELSGHIRGLYGVSVFREGAEENWQHPVSTDNS